MCLDLKEMPFASPDGYKRFFGAPIRVNQLMPSPIPLEVCQRILAGGKSGQSLHSYANSSGGMNLSLDILWAEPICAKQLQSKLRQTPGDRGHLPVWGDVC
jgi:hypothetical protein